MAWASGGNLIEGRRNHGGLGVYNAAVAISGYNTALLSTTEHYNGTSWSAGGNVATARHYGAGCGTLSAGLFIGGYTTTYVATTEEYNGTTWSAGGNLATARNSHAGFGTQISAVAAGGVAASALLSVEHYDGTSWSAGTSLSAYRAQAPGHGTLSAGLVAGGTAGAVTDAAKSDSLEYNGTTWSAGGTLGTARELHAGIGTQTDALVVAGASYSGGWTNYSSSESYNGTSFSAGSSITTATRLLAGAGTASNALIFGGLDTTYTAVTELYTSTISYSYTATGGAIAGGSADYTRIALHIATGGALGGGAVSYLRTQSFLPDGGGIAGGNADYTFNGGGQYTMDGGGVAGGSADYIRTTSFIASGGGIAGGSAPYSFTISANIQEIMWELYDAATGSPITGATNSTTIKFRRTPDGKIYDWADSTFKSSGWTSITTPLTEKDSVNLAGVYVKEIDVAALADGKYQIFVSYTGSTPIQRGSIEFLIENGNVWDVHVAGNADTTTSSRLAAASYTAPDNAGIAALQTDADFLVSVIKNRRYLEKVGSTWYLVILNDAEDAEIVRKALKGPNGTTEISDVKATAMGIEVKSSV